MTRLILLLASIVLLGCGDQPGVTTDLVNIPGSSDDPRKLPVITFTEAEYNFGTIAEGELVKHTFTFKNTGKAPLILSKVEPSCGCTAMRDWPREPIPPGKGGSISIEFDSSNRPGFQRKSITVLANTVPTRNVIHFQGDVLGPEAP